MVCASNVAGGAACRERERKSANVIARALPWRSALAKVNGSAPLKVLSRPESRTNRSRDREGASSSLIGLKTACESGALQLHRRSLPHRSTLPDRKSRRVGKES